MKNSISIRLFALVLTAAVAVSGRVSAQQSAARESMDAAIEQSNGQYSEIDMPYLWSLGMQQKAWNKPLEHLGEGQSKPGYSRYFWSPDLVLPLRIREGMHTLINFPSWEYIDNVFLGNASAFGSQKVAANALMVFANNPELVGMDTNMIVFGRSGNRYVFYLRSETFNADRITNAVVDIIVNDSKFVPDDSGKTPFSAGETGVGATPGGATSVAGSAGKAKGKKLKFFDPMNDWLEDLDVDPEKLKFDVDVFVPNPEDMEIAPERVWRDEIFTYIDLGPKALTMLQRPIVNLLVQGSEVPVGFRTRGPNGRLIVVEGIGDLVLRNGKRLLCLKIRKDPSFGTDWVEYDQSVQPAYSPAGMRTPGVSPRGANEIANEQASTQMTQQTMMQRAQQQRMSDNLSLAGRDAQISASFANRYRRAATETIAIELGADAEISALEQKWDNIYRKNKDLLANYEPYYSVDAVAEGESKDLFRLRIGPVESIKDGDKLCNQLGRRGVTCIVVRTQ